MIEGPTPAIPDWDRAWRSQLLDNLEILVRQLWTVGVEGIWIDGSFVEAKARPGDIDGYFDVPLFELPTLARKLNRRARERIWTWDRADRTPFEGSGARTYLPMWHRYRIELFPVDLELYDLLTDEQRDEQLPRLFSRTKERRVPKGLLELLR